MSNVVQMSRSCEYLVSRAARHRRAGRYDEAMALLSRARDQFGVQEEIEMETAYAGAMLNIDTFNQPGVEGGKNATYALFGKKGYEKTREEMENAPKKNSDFII